MIVNGTLLGNLFSFPFWLFLVDLNQVVCETFVIIVHFLVLPVKKHTL